LQAELDHRAGNFNAIEHMPVDGITLNIWLLGDMTRP